MDAGDQDLGSGGLSLLDPTVFKGTGVNRMAVTAGKSGKVYVFNADNLGGYRLGAGNTDLIVQTIPQSIAVFGGVGSYPSEGGYIYLTPVGQPTFAYKLGLTSSGTPQFAPAGQSHEKSAGRVGVGVPTVTSLNGQQGTGILWMTDPDVGLRAWYAVPGADGFLTSITLPQVNGLNKFQRPVFGDSRLYVSDPNGVVYCLGSPVNLPLNCSSPVNFGDVALGSSATQTVSCKAVVGITSLNGLFVGDSYFQVSNGSLPPGPINAGATFSFPVTWNLTKVVVQDVANTSYGSVSPGVKSTALTIYTTNAVAGYSTAFPISLTGNEVSSNPYLSIAPTTVDFGGIVLTNGSGASVGSIFTLANKGLAPLNILGYAFTTGALSDGAKYTNVTFGADGTATLGNGFVSFNLPPPGTIINPSSSEVINIRFTAVNGTGSYASYLRTWSNGGTTNTILEGSAASVPVANFSISTSEKGWLPRSNLLMDFGQVTPGSTTTRQIRICNVGGSVLTITKSKPPLGTIHVAAFGVDLHESQTIPVQQCAYGSVLFVAPNTNLNEPPATFTNTWTLNTDDLTFGVHEVQITGTVLSTQVGPTNSSGLAVYEYLGCYYDNTPGIRLLPNLLYDNTSNQNGLCQTAALQGRYAFVGSEYQTQCWAGNKPPFSQYLDTTHSRCTFACPGNVSQACGGDGGYISVYYDPSKYTPGNGTNAAAIGGPYLPNRILNYNYVGCYNETANGRALSGLAPAAPANGGSLETCAASCQGFVYFGSEYGGECYCGNSFPADSQPQPSTDPNTNGCAMTCAGNSTEWCGGPNRLTVYQFNSSLPATNTTATAKPGSPTTLQASGNWTYIGCYTEGTTGRALTGLANPVPAANNTVGSCTAACQGFSYAAVEFSGECYCGNSITNGATVAPGGSSPSSNGCSNTCTGDPTTYCGGASRLNIYHTNDTSASAPTTTNPSSGLFIPQNEGTWVYEGCFVESTTGRALNGKLNPISANVVSVNTCVTACAGYAFAGMEYATEVGNTLQFES